MVDIQSAMAEIREERKKERRTNDGMNIYIWSALLHRVTIKEEEEDRNHRAKI